MSPYFKSEGHERLALVAAHPPKVGEGRAPALVAGLARAKARVRHPPVSVLACVSGLVLGAGGGWVSWMAAVLL